MQIGSLDIYSRREIYVRGEADVGKIYSHVLHYTADGHVLRAGGVCDHRKFIT